MKRTLSDVNPELASEWSEKNASLKPQDVSYGSNKKVWWKGSCGHEWQATVKNRVNGSDCPYCSGNKILYGFNDLETVYPEAASEWSELNYPLIPSAVAVKSNRKIWWKCRNCSHQWQARIADRTDGHGCPVCAGEKLVPGVNDFATEHPDLAAEWSERNTDLKPDQIWSKSRANVWWICPECEGEWQAVVNSRVDGLGCPYCEDKRVKKGLNDIATTHPELLKEWDYTANENISPDMVSANSMKIVHWKDWRSHCWSAKIADRVAGAGCPYCAESFEAELKHKAMVYYAKKYDDEPVGIPLDMHFPELRGVIEFHSPEWEKTRGRRWENAKNWLCLNAGIRMIRILAPKAGEFNNCVCITCIDDSYGVLSMALGIAFEVLGVDVDVDIERDMAKICRG